MKILPVKKMNKTTIDKYETFLNKHKGLLGLSDWTITVEKEAIDTNNLAEVDTNHYEKELTITLSKEFNKLTANKKKNVLLHELIHGRIELYNQKSKLLLEELEEELANDITRGFERHKQLKW